jgi:hypothetical protein
MINSLQAAQSAGLGDSQHVGRSVCTGDSNVTMHQFLAYAVNSLSTLVTESSVWQPACKICGIAPVAEIT